MSKIEFGKAILGNFIGKSQIFAFWKVYGGGQILPVSNVLSDCF